MTAASALALSLLAPFRPTCLATASAPRPEASAAFQEPIQWAKEEEEEGGETAAAPAPPASFPFPAVVFATAWATASRSLRVSTPPSNT